MKDSVELIGTQRNVPVVVTFTREDVDLLEQAISYVDTVDHDRGWVHTDPHEPVRIALRNLADRIAAILLKQ